MQYWLPMFNTALILISGVALVVGYTFIRRGDVRHHKWSMLTATTFAGLFLVVYLTRSALYGGKLFSGTGTVKVIYLIILTTHTILATAIVPLVLLVLYRALKRQFPRHKRIARKTLPMWLYVVVTGWIIYMMLYQINFSKL